MIIKFKVISSNRDEWLGWFGEDLIKVRVNSSDLKQGLIQILKHDLGIDEAKIYFIKEEKDFFTIKFPDIAWELFLTVVK